MSEMLLKLRNSMELTGDEDNGVKAIDAWWRPIRSIYKDSQCFTLLSNPQESSREALLCVDQEHHILSMTLGSYPLLVGGLRGVADVGIGDGKGVVLEWEDGNSGHSQTGTLSCCPADMFWATNGQPYVAWSSNLGRCVERSKTGLEAEVRMIEDDDTNGPDNSVETPKNE